MDLLALRIARAWGRDPQWLSTLDEETRLAVWGEYCLTHGLLTPEAEVLPPASDWCPPTPEALRQGADAIWSRAAARKEASPNAITP